VLISLHAQAKLPPSLSLPPSPSLLISSPCVLPPPPSQVTPSIRPLHLSLNPPSSSPSHLPRPLFLSLQSLRLPC
ncbi:Os08g0396200, partial [Oryza sativa Japonica Group]